jgi:Rrf2 family protein
MQVSARMEYAVQALVELAAQGGGPVKGERLAEAQHIPSKFLEAILAQLRHDGLLLSRRGGDGGYWLARPAAAITVADVMRAVDGPLARVRGLPPETVFYRGAAERLSDVWIAVRASLRDVLEQVTIADLVDGHLPEALTSLTADPDARIPH